MKRKHIASYLKKLAEIKPEFKKTLAPLLKQADSTEFSEYIAKTPLDIFTDYPKERKRIFKILGPAFRPVGAWNTLTAGEFVIEFKVNPTDQSFSKELLLHLTHLDFFRWITSNVRGVVRVGC